MTTVELGTDMTEPLAGVAVLLGSGMGAASDGFPTDITPGFDTIPGMDDTSVPGHDGELRRCRVGDVPCLFVLGRKHYYEAGARSVEQMQTLVSWLRDRGVRSLLLTSAAGTLTTLFRPGDLVLVEDIVDLQFRRPASVGRRGEPLVLDDGMKRAIASAAIESRIPLRSGVAATLSGPAYETPAEIAALQRLGIDVVTMSGAPEIEFANSIGIRVASIAVVTNWACGTGGQTTLDHREVVERGRQASGTLRKLISQFAPYCAA